MERADTRSGALQSIRQFGRSGGKRRIQFAFRQFERIELDSVKLLGIAANGGIALGAHGG